MNFTLHGVNLTPCKVYGRLYRMSSPETDTRRRILKETWHLMELRRGQGVRVEDIAKAAGVSRQAVYLHFGSRSGLMIAAARYLDEVLNLPERLQSVLSATSGVQMVEAYVNFWGNYIPEIYGLAKALITAQDTDEAAAAAWKDRMEALHGGCLQVVRCLQRDGVLAPEWTIDDAADFFWATLSIPMWEHLTTERGWSKFQYISRLEMVLKKALLRTV